MKLNLLYSVFKRFDAGPSAEPCDESSSENGTNSVGPCESLTIEKQVFESSVANPKFELELESIPLLVAFSLLSPLLHFEMIFFFSIVDMGTHLYIFIVVSPIVTHFFCLKNSNYYTQFRPGYIMYNLPVPDFVNIEHYPSFRIILRTAPCFCTNGTTHIQRFFFRRRN